MAEGLRPAARSRAVPPMTEKRDAAVVPAYARRWWRWPAEAPISGAGCPARPTAAWRCRAPSAPGRRRAARHFAARRRGLAPSSPAAATRQTGWWAPATRPFPMPAAQRLQLARMLPAASMPERLVSSAVRRRSRGRTTARSPAATTTNRAAAGPSSRSSARPCRRRTARPRWRRRPCTPSPGSGRGCARFACRAKADRPARGHPSRRPAEAWCPATARSHAGRRRSRIPPRGDAGPKQRARAWTELLRRRSSPQVPARRHHCRGADRLAQEFSLVSIVGRPVLSHLNPPGCRIQATAV